MEGIRRVSRRCLEVFRDHGWCLEGVWNKKPHLILLERKAPCVLKVSGSSLKGLWEMCGKWLEGACA